MITYPIHEMFRTFQGEGFNMGKPAFFVRTMGCPVGCTFCDSAGTWHPKHVPKDVKKMTIDELLNAVGSTEMVVITGGEPAVHKLFPLVDALQKEGKMVCIETSGGFVIDGSFDWFTVSPKRWGGPLVEENVMLADEFKFIIERPDDIEFYTKKVLDEGKIGFIPVDIWLHPEWSQRSNWTVLNAITEAVKTNAYPYRAGVQLHKYYKADELSGQARPAVPLGGDELRNF